MKDYPNIDIGYTDWYEDQFFCVGAAAYAVEDLWDLAKDLPTYEVPLVGFQTDIPTWADDVGSMHGFVKHMKLVAEADMSYPIILDPAGDIADGRHRLAKAILQGDTTIQIIRLETLPDPAYCFEAEEE
jgi:hypothetical protein